MAIGTPRIGAIAISNTETGTLAVPYPSSVVIGEFLSIDISARTDSDTDPAYTASGWQYLEVQSGTSTRKAYLWKIADSSDVGVASKPVVGPAVLRTMKMIAVPGVDTTNPIDAISYYDTDVTTATATVTMASLTPTRAGSLLLWGVTGFLGAYVKWDPTYNGGAINPNATEWVDTWQEVTTSSTYGRSGAAYWEEWPTTNPTGERGAAAQSAATSAGIYMVLRPAVYATAAVGDSSGFIDVAGTRLTVVRGAAEAGQLTDSVIASLGRTVTVADVIQGTESSTANRGDTQSRADSATLADSVTGSMTTQRSVPDPAALSDSTSMLRTTVRALSDQTPITDTAIGGIGRSRGITDAATVSDAVNALISLGAFTGDIIGVSDSVSIVQAMRPAPADPEGLQDNVSTLQTQSVSRTDSATLTDAVSRSADVQRSATDTAALSDSVSFVRTIHQSPADSLQGADAVLGGVSGARVVGDVSTLDDMTRLYRHIQKVDSFEVGAGPGFGEVSFGTGLFGGEVTGQPVLQSGDRISISDVIRVSQGPGRIVNENIGITESTRLSHSRSAVDIVGITDTVTYSKQTVVKDIVALRDSVVVVQIIRRSPVDRSTFRDNVTLGGTASRPVETTANVVADADIGVRQVHRLKASTTIDTTVLRAEIVKGPQRMVVDSSITGNLSSVRAMVAAPAEVIVELLNPRIRVVRAMTDVIRTFDELPMGLLSDMDILNENPEPVTTEPRRYVRTFAVLR